MTFAEYIKYNEILFKEFNIDTNTLKTEFEKGSGSLNDFAWSMYNKFLIEIGNFQDISDGKRNYKLNRVYIEMLTFLRKFEKKKGNHILKQCFITETRALSETDLVYTANIIAGDNCEYALTLEDEEFEIDDDLINFPIDFNKCNREEGCNCGLDFQPKRNEKNELIHKVK